MTKINIRLPEPKEEYDVSNQKQINRALTIMKDQLNSTFLDEVKQEQERVSWFIGGYRIYKRKKRLNDQWGNCGIYGARVNNWYNKINNSI